MKNAFFIWTLGWSCSNGSMIATGYGRPKFHLTIKWYTVVYANVQKSCIDNIIVKHCLCWQSTSLVWNRISSSKEISFVSSKFLSFFCEDIWTPNLLLTVQYKVFRAVANGNAWMFLARCARLIGFVTESWTWFRPKLWCCCNRKLNFWRKMHQLQRGFAIYMDWADLWSKPILCI